MVAGQSTVVSSFAVHPLKLLTPRSRGQSAWIYASSFGGGLVAGDETRLDLRVGERARGFLGTQASTKIYRNPSSLPCSHVTRAVLEAGSLLVFAPDPVQPFAASLYGQRQEFHLASDASLVLVDWLSSGRAARGERWAFASFQSQNEVFVAGRRRLFDALRLDPSDGPLTGCHRLGRFNCIALLVVIGPAVRDAAARLLESVAALPAARRSSVVCSASPLGEGALLRWAGERIEDVGSELRRRLAFAGDLLGDDPWVRKW